MKMMKLLIAALLAVTLAASAGSTIVAPSFNMFSAPDLSLKSLGFGQITPTDVMTKPTIFAPQNALLLHGAQLAPHVKPRLGTTTWAPSMKGSSINQMFAILAGGIGSKSGLPAGHHTGV